MVIRTSNSQLLTAAQVTIDNALDNPTILSYLSDPGYDKSALEPNPPVGWVEVTLAQPSRQSNPTTAN